MQLLIPESIGDGQRIDIRQTTVVETIQQLRDAAYRSAVGAKQSKNGRYYYNAEAHARSLTVQDEYACVVVPSIAGVAGRQLHVRLTKPSTSAWVEFNADTISYLSDVLIAEIRLRQNTSQRQVTAEAMEYATAKASFSMGGVDVRGLSYLRRDRAVVARRTNAHDKVQSKYMKIADDASVHDTVKAAIDAKADGWSECHESDADDGSDNAAEDREEAAGELLLSPAVHAEEQGCDEVADAMLREIMNS